MITIRPEAPGDVPAVRRVNESAFGRPEEADLVDKLRQADPDILSLVADDNGIVGHIVFSPAAIESGGRRIVGMGLAPMAVVPERQRQGIGSRLVRQGLAMLRARGCPFVVVVGHQAYYPRFGFARASDHGFVCQWPSVPDSAFMMLVLDGSVLAGVSGLVKYRREFDEVE